jgi:flagellar FliJ protein
MKRSRRIERIREVARFREEALQRTLSRARAALAEEERRLHTLRRYREEYHGQFRELGAAGLPAGTAADYLRFVERLERAVREQEVRVEAAREAHQAALSHWRAGHRRTQSLDKLAGRLRSEEGRQARHRDQREMDEAAARTRRSR